METMHSEGKLWEVTLMAFIFKHGLPSQRKVKVRAWTGLAAELKAVEQDPKWTAITKRTKLLEEVE